MSTNEKWTCAVHQGEDVSRVEPALQLFARRLLEASCEATCKVENR